MVGFLLGRQQHHPPDPARARHDSMLFLSTTTRCSLAFTTTTQKWMFRSCARGGGAAAAASLPRLSTTTACCSSTWPRCRSVSTTRPTTATTTTTMLRFPFSSTSSSWRHRPSTLQFSLRAAKASNDAAAAPEAPPTKLAAAAAPAKTKAPKLRKTQLRADLKQYRIQQSAPLNKPPYTIFTNAAIDGIYALLPTTKEELLQVKGIGPMKLEMFGEDILEIVSKYTGGGDSSDDESSTRSSSSTATTPDSDGPRHADRGTTSRRGTGAQYHCYSYC